MSKMMKELRSMSGADWVALAGQAVFALLILWPIVAWAWRLLF